MKNTIIKQAIELGFDFSELPDNIELQQIERVLIEFFNENSDKLEQLEDECEVSSNGRTQDVIYGDYICSGEIVDFRKYWHESPDYKVFHSSFVLEDNDGIMKYMNLYYLVGETDYNKLN